MESHEEQVVNNVKDNNDDSVPHANEYDDIWCAARRGDRKAVRTFLNNGSDPDIEDECGNPPLYYSVLYGHKKICKDLNIHLMIDPYIITHNDIKILLLHGDTLCTDDKAYQDFREMVRSKNWQNEMLSKTLEERLFLADNLRKKSIAANKEKGEDIMDVNNHEINKIIEEYSPDIIIHGHTHRPNVHKHNEVKRYVLGDWYDSFYILSLKDNKFTINKGRLK